MSSYKLTARILRRRGRKQAVATHRIVYVPMKRKSRAGVEYTYYKKVMMAV